MKKLLLSILLTASVVASVNAQQSYTYLFSSAPFISNPSGGPNLDTIGVTTTPVSVRMPVTTCADTPLINLTHFEQNAGFKAKAFFAQTYSIEMIFRFDILSAYRRIIDFSNSLADVGIYALQDCLNFYPSGSIGTCPGAFNLIDYKQLVITRDSATQAMNIYFNGTLFITYADVSGYYKINPAPNDTIKFFRDDNLVPNEASSGDVALITLADYVFTPSEVTISYNDFCNHITGIQNSIEQTGFRIYPNPATNKITVSGVSLNSIEIYNALGEKVYSLSALNQQTTNEIDLSLFSKGIYFVKGAIAAGKQFSQKLVVE